MLLDLVEAVFGLLVVVVEMVLFMVPAVVDLVVDLADLMLVVVSVDPAPFQFLLKERMVQQTPAVGLGEELQVLPAVPVS